MIKDDKSNTPAARAHSQAPTLLAVSDYVRQVEVALAGIEDALSHFRAEGREIEKEAKRLGLM